MGALPDWTRTPQTTDIQLHDLPRHAGLYGLLGYSSRGLVWAQLLAEALVCELEGEPLPMEADLITAIDPGRFMLRTIRREGRTK
jgi:tRNA 5-methylaminomethyl-2-thiouridine biosynthesis bifunctional protein